MQTTIRNIIFFLTLTLTVAACSDGADALAPCDPDTAGTVRVTVGAASGSGVDTRTQIDDEGIGVKWMPGDRIALWALNAENVAVLDAQTFGMLHYNATYDSARFTADIAPMAAGSYTYYAVSPAPAATQGTRASFDIPAVQNGSAQLACDVMVAQPVANGGPLVEGDNSDALSLHFSHKVHVLKIHIPANRMEQPVSRLTLTFPVPVTGRMTVDAADPDAAIELPTDEAGKTLTLEFDTPKDAGDTVFAVIAPVELGAEDEIEITAYADAQESFPVRMPGKRYRAGHTTPVNLTIPERYRITRIFFSLAGRGGALDLPEDLAEGYGCSTLGEPVRTLRIVKSDTGEVIGEFSDLDTSTNSYQIFSEGAFRTDLSGAEATVQFESDHAMVERHIVLPEFIADQSNTVPAFEVPWLFEEDFSGVGDLSNHDNAEVGGSKIDSYTDAIDLSGYNLPGWSATRVGMAAGKALRICVRTEDALLACTRYHGRVDTAPLAAIRVPVGVTVSFDYSIDGTRSEHIPYAAWGYHTAEGLIKSVNSTSTALDAPVRTGVTGSGGDYDTIDQHEEYTIADCTGATRLAWDIYSSGRKTGNSNGWLYIDNIRVSIAR